MPAPIRVRGARQHNLRCVDLDLPRGRLVVLTGVSGSGKSSLALDTIHAEAQRRYAESLSTYAKQFLERVDRPDVDAVENVPPTVAIEPRNRTLTSRSTVGTATETADYLRLLMARAGRTRCPDCDRDVRPDTVEDAAARLAGLPDGTRIHVAFPPPRSAPRAAGALRASLLAAGYVRVLAAGRELAVEDAGGALEHPGLLVVADRLVLGPASRARLVEALAAAFRAGDGEACAAVGGAAGEVLRFTRAFRCGGCGRGFAPPTPGLFSFNNPWGACPRCRGFGNLLEFHADVIVPDPARSLREGAIHPWTAPRYRGRRRRLAAFCARAGISLDAPWRDLSEPDRRRLLEGAPGFEGVIPFLHGLVEKKYKAYVRFFLRRYQKLGDCPACAGTRLRPEALHVRLGGATVVDLSALPVERLRAFLAGLELTPLERAVAGLVADELDARLEILESVGLGYLSLDRATRTLSGGEAQRIGLANALGGRLVDTLYVLDEPSVGLHAVDTERLIAILRRLRDRGNTVLVVEHDLDVMAAADWIVELGPGAGERGGAVTFAGTPAELAASDGPTGPYLSGLRTIDVPAGPLPLAAAALARGRAAPARGSARWRAAGARNGGGRTARAAGGRAAVARGAASPALVLEGASARNLRGVDVRIPLGAVTAVSGVSGSGKSTLVHDTLYRAVAERLGERTGKPYLGQTVGRHRALSGWERLGGVALVDQSPIGKSPRSNPVTYVGAFAPIREAFAATPLARARGAGAGAFSFNVAGGRCEACKGDGHERVEMQFLADVYVTCPACGGSRYARETLAFRHRGMSIAEVLTLTVDEAVAHFSDAPEVGRRLRVLQAVGLGYLRLGQPAPALSGGEAQRLKIARALREAPRGGRGTLYVMDEPSVGLHPEDVARLLRILRSLAGRGDTVVMVEHHLDLIAAADHVIDLGPGAGAEGGAVLAQGPPAEVAAAPGSRTGAFLRRRLEGRIPRRAGSGADEARAARAACA
jgi:excinuclease ABC subunit A